MNTALLMMLSFFTGAVCDTSDANEMRPRALWEYKQLQADVRENSEVLQKRMDELGADGWELAGVVARRGESGTDTLLFKRIKQSSGVKIELNSETGVMTVRGTKDAVDTISNQIKDISKQPKTDDSVRIDAETGVLVIRGSKESVDRAKELIDQIKR